MQAPETFDDMVNIFFADQLHRNRAASGDSDSDDDHDLGNGPRLRVNKLLAKQMELLFPEDLPGRRLDTHTDLVVRMIRQNRKPYLQKLKRLLQQHGRAAIDALVSGGLQLEDELPGTHGATMVMFCAQEGALAAIQACKLHGGQIERVMPDLERRVQPSLLAGVCGVSAPFAPAASFPIARPCRSAFYFAAASGRIAVLDFLLNALAESDGHLESAESRRAILVDALGAASHKGHAKCVIALLSHGAAALANGPWQADSARSLVDALTFLDCTALMAASACGHEAAVVALIDTPHLVNAKIDLGRGDVKLGRAALHYACRYGSAGIVKKLLEAQADTAAVDRLSNTALHVACCFGRVEVVRQLVAERAQVNVSNSHGFTPLMLAAAQPRLPPVCPGGHVLYWSNYRGGGYTTGWVCNGCGGKDLGSHRFFCLGCSFDLCRHCAETRRSVLQWSPKDFPEALDLLDGATRTCYYLECVKILLEADADVTLEDNDGSTALHHAALATTPPHLHDDSPSTRYCSPSSVAGLGGPGAAGSMIPWDHAVIPRELISGGNLSLQQIDKGSASGRRAIHHGAAAGNLALVSELLALKADLDGAASCGSTPLIVALDHGRWNLAARLLEDRADVGCRLRGCSDIRLEGSTPLILATARLAALPSTPVSSKQVLEALLLAAESGEIDVNAQTACQATALIIASAGGLDELVKRLLKIGAEISVQIKWPASYTVPVRYVVSTTSTPEAKRKIRANIRTGLASPLSLVPRCLPELNEWTNRKYSHPHLTDNEVPETSILEVKPQIFERDSKFKQELEDKAIELTNLSGWSALHFASASRSSQTVQALLNAKASMTDQTDEGFTALHVACLASNDRACSRILTAREKTRPAPSLIAMRDKKGRRALDLASAEMRFMYLFAWS